ncbi:MAG: histidine kinase [Bacteroidota bacterium]|nr:histidine kinase [Bacteroidota bacterium]
MFKNSSNFIEADTNLKLLQITSTFSISRAKAYWLLQITGWCLVSILNMAVLALVHKMNFPHFLLLSFLAFAGIAFTHLFRNIIKKEKWVDLSLRKVAFRVIPGSFLTGAAIYLCYFAIAYFTGLTNREVNIFLNILLGSLEITGIVFGWFLIYFIVHILGNYKKAEIEALIWEAAVKDFELKTLKSQLNPHFMFNAMNSIRALIEENPERAKTALTKLSNILRYSLKIERTETVSLADEMQIIYDYLDLEKMRFEERLGYKIDISPESASVEIPPMMVQTLVENGIKHGISKLPEGGEIEINSYIEDSFLHLCVKNTGIFVKDVAKYSEGIGINNTRHRLMLLYGEKATLELNNTADNIVSAEIHIPLGGINR